MQILGCFCLFVLFFFSYHYYKWCLQFSIGLYLMEHVPRMEILSQKTDFGIGFLVYGHVPHVINGLGLILLLGLGLKALQYGCQFKGLSSYVCQILWKSSDSIGGLCVKDGFGEACETKVLPCKYGLLGLMKISSSKKLDNLVQSVEPVNSPIWRVKDTANEEFDKCGDDTDDDNGELYDEDDHLDVVQLRKLLNIERKKANVACMELEKERMAAASSAEEAMGMIMRLQNEKSLIEIEAHNYRKVAEQKQLYDQQVIQSLRWMVLKHESERSLLEDELRLCRQRLKLHLMGNEIDQLEEFSPISTNANMEDDLDDFLVSSLEMERQCY